MTEIRIEIEKYEGPLDLLLTLITKNKIDIFDIPIAVVAEQYNDYLDELHKDNMEVAADFVRMAAELMLIKSKMLLPKKEDEEDPRQPLVDALLEYRRAKETSEFLKDRAETYFDRFVKQPEILDLPYLKPHEKELLSEAFARIYQRLKAKPEETNEVFETIKQNREYTVEEKSDWLLSRLSAVRIADFEQLFSELGSVGELCATFLALLTLVAAGRVGIMKNGSSALLVLNENVSDTNIGFEE